MNARKVAQRIAVVAAAFAFLVIVFGAFVRLSNAGLSCPDWPTCYGKATWPGHEHEIARANEAFPERPFEDHKAWREQVHRMLAGLLGGLVFALALAAAWRKRSQVASLAGAALAAALGVVLYMRGEASVSSLLSLVAIATSARRPTASPIGLRFSRSRSPPHPKTTSKRRGPSARNAAHTHSSASGVCA